LFAWILFHRGCPGCAAAVQRCSAPVQFQPAPPAEGLGLEMPEMKFAGDRSLAVTRRTEPDAAAEKILSIMKLTSSQQCFNKDNPVSAELNDVTMVFPGVLNVLEGQADAPKLEHIPLVTTSPKGNSWTVGSPFELTNPDYRKFMQDFIDGSKPVVMGYMVTGNFRSAFPDGIEIQRRPPTNPMMNQARRNHRKRRPPKNRPPKRSRD